MLLIFYGAISLSNVSLMSYQTPKTIKSVCETLQIFPKQVAEPVLAQLIT